MSCKAYYNEKKRPDGIFQLSNLLKHYISETGLISVLLGTVSKRKPTVLGLLIELFLNYPWDTQKIMLSSGFIPLMTRTGQVFIK
jgi:hypothetical protein